MISGGAAGGDRTRASKGGNLLPYRLATAASSLITRKRLTPEPRQEARDSNPTTFPFYHLQGQIYLWTALAEESNPHSVPDATLHQPLFRPSRTARRGAGISRLQCISGADGGDRTRDLFVGNEVRYLCATPAFIKES